MPTDSKLLLLPTPRSITMTGPAAALMGATPLTTAGLDLLGQIDAPVPGLRLAPAATPAEAHVRLELSASAFEHDEAYRVTIRPPDRRPAHPISVEARSARGLRHGLSTLAQILRQCEQDAVPCLMIEDEPSVETRGVMIDISRCKVPTMDSLREMVDVLASLKVNHLQMYTEHAFAYAGHEEVWADVSPITPDEVRELDAYCAKRGVELCPNQNCFGHLADWLRHPKYAHLAETHGDWKFMDFDRSGPFSLCPSEPGSIELVRDLLGQLLPCFSSRRVNIGCDETFDIGQGRSKEEVRRRGRAVVYLEFVRKVAAIAREHGRRPMMWADIALSDPEALGDMPEGVVGLAWGYEPDAEFGEWCDLLNANGIEAWVCPGTSSWRSIYGRTSERRENISRAAEAGAAKGATGLLICDWGDTGHHQHWPIAALGLAHGAEAAWNARTAREFDARAATVHALGAGAELGPWLEELGDLDVRLRRGCEIKNASALFNDFYRCYGAKPIAASAKRFSEMDDRLDDLGAAPGVPAGSLMERELKHTVALARLALKWGAAARRDRPPSGGERREFAERLRALVAEHRDLWLKRNRIGGLEKSCGYFEPVLARIEGADAAQLRREHPV